MILLLFACASPSESWDTGIVVDDDSGPADEIGDDTGGVDRDDTGGGGDGGGDTGGGPAGPPVHHAVSRVQVADGGTGFDLDGDGDVDNALSVASMLLNPTLEGALASANNVLVLQFSGLDDWTDDASYTQGLFSASDTDGDTSDNFSGSEVFDASGQVDGDGQARVAGPGSVSAGVFEARVDAGGIEVGGYTFEAASSVRIAGSGDASWVDGVIGMAMPLDAALTLAKQLGAGDYASYIAALADIDTDGDGAPDAISMAFTYEAVSAGISY